MKLLQELLSEARQDRAKSKKIIQQAISEIIPDLEKVLLRAVNIPGEKKESGFQIEGQINFKKPIKGNRKKIETQLLKLLKKGGLQPTQIEAFPTGKFLEVVVAFEEGQKPL